MRKFYFENENGTRLNLNNTDAKNKCLFLNPTGLGYSYNIEYSQIGDNFISNKKQISQGQVGGTLITSYASYSSFVNFIENSNKLKFIYVINNIEYYRDIEVISLDKSEKSIGYLHTPITINCTSLWYKQNNTIYTITSLNEDAVRWSFKFPSKFISYNNRSILYENKGHVEAPFKLEISGYVINPSITIKVNDNIVNELIISKTFEFGEKLLYCTKDTEMYIYKQKADGSLINLFDDLNMNKINFFKLPKSTCQIILSADDDIQNAKLTIYEQYKSV